MAQERSLIPEKQLLNLIESPKIKDAAIRSGIVTHHGMGLFSPGAWRGRISFFRDYLKKVLGGGFQQPDLKVVNRVLAVIIVISVFYLVNTSCFSIIRLKKMPSLKSAKQESAKHAGFKEAALQQPVVYYVDKVRQRDIFKIGAKKTVAGKSPAVAASAITEAMEHLKLVGISWSSDPDAMIEDTKALRTFFVKRGHMIGQVRIEAIFKDKIILSCEGKEAELK
jgi:hypothetical protein